MSQAWTVRNARWLAPPLGLGVCALALALVRVFEHWRLPLPRCGLRTLTGLPCPTCGGTRCLLALSESDIGKAFQFNPLVALASLALCVWTGLWLLDLCCHRNWAGRVASTAQRSPWPWPLALAALLNWIYLLFCLPG